LVGFASLGNLACFRLEVAESSISKLLSILLSKMPSKHASPTPKTFTWHEVAASSEEAVLEAAQELENSARRLLEEGADVRARKRLDIGRYDVALNWISVLSNSDPEDSKPPDLALAAAAFPNRPELHAWSFGSLPAPEDRAEYLADTFVQVYPILRRIAFSANDTKLLGGVFGLAGNEIVGGRTWQSFFLSHHLADGRRLDSLPVEDLNVAAMELSKLGPQWRRRLQLAARDKLQEAGAKATLGILSIFADRSKIFRKRLRPDLELLDLVATRIMDCWLLIALDIPWSDFHLPRSNRNHVECCFLYDFMHLISTVINESPKAWQNHVTLPERAERLLLVILGRIPKGHIVEPGSLVGCMTELLDFVMLESVDWLDIPAARDLVR